ncbi:hypothetical protein V500_04533 [Pseudogymnoascus sp. VKM F-4518 (FW-2643)]|nr:hypothetical protein V500_04533 [Pseudogymnoascus sp. VKM F-4518 (FW-2643)]
MSSDGSPTRILLVVDVQRSLFDPPNPVPGSTQILRTLEAALARERAASPPTKVIWIRHGEDDDPDFAPNTTPWEIVQTELFRIQENEVIVDKTTPDSFHKTSLASHIETAGFDPQSLQLVIMGLQSDYCIQATARSAIARYPSARVSLVHGAHGTYNDEKNGRSAEEVSEQIEKELKDEGVIIEDSFTEVIRHTGLLQHLGEAKGPDTVGERQQAGKSGANKCADTERTPTVTLKPGV